MSCKVVDVHHRRSPLVQGGLEIPCEVTVEMAMTNKVSLLTSTNGQYQEPVEGKFPDAGDTGGYEVTVWTTTPTRALASQSQSRITIISIF